MLNELFPKRTSLALLNLYSSLNLPEFMISRSAAYYNMIARKQSRTRREEGKPNVLHRSNRISSRYYYREKAVYISLTSTYILSYVFPCIPRKYQILGPRPLAYYNSRYRNIICKIHINFARRALGPEDTSKWRHGIPRSSISNGRLAFVPRVSAAFRFARARWSPPHPFSRNPPAESFVAIHVLSRPDSSVSSSPLTLSEVL